MPTNSEVDVYNHFVIPAKPHFFEYQLHLSDASKLLFAKGAPGQGFVGLVDLETNLIHLFPAFNKDDGQLRLDRDGQKFSKLAETAQTLGGGAGDLHMRTAAILSLGDKAGNKQNLMGFGIWKGGQSVKFLAELPSSDLRLIPNEYLVIKDENNQWKIFYVDDDKAITEVTLNAAQKEALAQLPTDVPPENINFEQRQRIIKTLKIDDPGNIKIIKNRSSSQNMFSCKYQPTYGEFFANMMPPGHRGSHQVALQRELPLPVLSTIINSVCEGLSIPLIGGLYYSELVPNDKNDARLRYHLEVESFWIRFQKILKALKALTNENNQFIAKHFNQDGKERWGASGTRAFLKFIEEKIDAGLIAETFLLMIKHQAYYELIFHLSTASSLNDLIKNYLRDLPHVLDDLLITIDQDLNKLYEKVNSGMVNEHNKFIANSLKEIQDAMATSVIQSIYKGDLKLTDTNLADITEFVLRNISRTNFEKINEFLSYLMLIKNEKTIDAGIVEKVIKQTIDAILKEIENKLENSSDVTEQRKIIMLLEKHDLLKSKNSLILANIVKYFDVYKKSPNFDVIKSSFSHEIQPSFDYRILSLLNMAKDIKADEPFKELVRNIIAQNPKESFYFLKMLEYEDWSALNEVLKETIPKEHSLYSILKTQLNILPNPPLSFGSEKIKYFIDVDEENGSLSLFIKPPGVIDYDYDGGVKSDSSNFRESLAEVLESLKKVGFPQNVLEKVSSDLNANLNVSSYTIELDQVTQVAIIEKNQQKPEANENVTPLKSENRRSLLLSDKSHLSRSDPQNIPSEVADKISDDRREKPSK